MHFSPAKPLLGLTAFLLLGLPASATDIDTAPTVAPSAYLQQGGPDTGTAPRRSPRPLHTPSTKPLQPHHRRTTKPVAPDTQSDHRVSYNARSRKFHEEGCRYWSGRAGTQMMMSEAIAKGGKPCHLCHHTF